MTTPTREAFRENTKAASSLVSSHRRGTVHHHLGDVSPRHDVQVRADVPAHHDVAQHSPRRAVAHPFADGEVVVARPFPPSGLIEITRQPDARSLAAVDEKGGHLSQWKKPKGEVSRREERVAVDPGVG